MTRLRTLFIGALLLLCLSACAQATPTPTPISQATTIPSATPVPTETPVPSATPEPSPTTVPTPAEVAPEEIFALIGSVAEFSGEHGVSGKAIVAGLQTLIIQRFNFDGKGPEVEIRLTLDGDAQGAVATLLMLDRRAYEDETLVLRIPTIAGPGSANNVTIYCPETDSVYATAKFR